MIRMYQHSMILIEFYQNICRLNLIILSCPGSVFFFFECWNKPRRCVFGRCGGAQTFKKEFCDFAAKPDLKTFALVGIRIP